MQKLTTNKTTVAVALILGSVLGMGTGAFAQTPPPDAQSIATSTSTAGVAALLPVIGIVASAFVAISAAMFAAKWVLRAVRTSRA